MASTARRLTLARPLSAPHACLPVSQARAPRRVHCAATTELQVGLPSYKTVTMRTRSDCQLAVSIFPMFAYDASVGSGTARAELEPSGRTRVSFDTSTLSIPDLNWRTTKVLGVPLPPPFNIAIRPLSLEGWVDFETGQAELDFDAEFQFTAGFFDRIHKTPHLQVTTTLTTEAATGKLRSGSGMRLVGGQGKLLGIARVPKTGDWFLDPFLMLPTDAFAMLSAEFTIVDV